MAQIPGRRQGVDGRAARQDREYTTGHAVPIPRVRPDFAQPNQPPPGCDELPPGVINLDPTKGPVRIRVENVTG